MDDGALKQSRGSKVSTLNT